MSSFISEVTAAIVDVRARLRPVHSLLPTPSLLRASPCASPRPCHSRDAADPLLRLKL
jgi:hypothetical protein